MLLLLARQTYVTLDVEFRGAGGHSMTPPKPGASVMSRLARLVAEIDKRPPAPDLQSPSLEFLMAVGGVASPILRAASHFVGTWRAPSSGPAVSAGVQYHTGLYIYLCDVQAMEIVCW